MPDDHRTRRRIVLAGIRSRRTPPPAIAIARDATVHLVDPRHEGLARCGTVASMSAGARAWTLWCQTPCERCQELAMVAELTRGAVARCFGRRKVR